VYSFGDFYLSGFGEIGHAEHKAPLELVLCVQKDCGLIQLKHTVSPDVLYSQGYWYKSGINPVIVENLKDIAKQAMKMVDLKKGDVILDIGANDGTLLSFIPKKYKRVACEPADNLQRELKKHADIIIHNLWNYEDYEKGKNYN